MPSNDGLQQMVKMAHQRSAADPIAYADEAGAFGASFLPFVFPIVIDANALRDELLRFAKTGQRTILANAGNTGVLRLFCAGHVVEEVEEHLADWAAQKRLHPADVESAWRTVYLPLLRCVDVPDGLLDPTEADRLDVLADPTNTYGDPDDVPTAKLALLLGAPLLSKDQSPLTAVYGVDFDHIAHANWLTQLRAGGDLGPLGQFLHLACTFSAGVGIGTYSGVRTLATKVPWPWLLVGGLATAGVFNAGVAAQARRRIRSALASGLKAVVLTLADLAEMHEAARAEFESLRPQTAPWADSLALGNGDAAVTRACLTTLARSPSSNLSAAELEQRLRGQWSFPVGETAIRRRLRQSSCFDQPYRGRFQVGRALARSGPNP